MTDSQTITLPRSFYLYTPAARRPSRLERIVDRQRDARTWDGLFAFGIAAFAILTALGIVG